MVHFITDTGANIVGDRKVLSIALSPIQAGLGSSPVSVFDLRLGGYGLGTLWRETFFPVI